MQELTKVLLYLLVFSLFGVLFLIKKLGEFGKKENIIRKKEEKIVSHTSNHVNNHANSHANNHINNFTNKGNDYKTLLIRCEESRIELEEVRTNKSYASLFEGLIPRIQQIMGLLQYRIDYSSKEKLLEDLRYLIGVNFKNDLYNQGFILDEQGSLNYVRKRKEQTTILDNNNLSMEELQQLILKYHSEKRKLDIFNKRKELCELLGKPLHQLRKMIDAGEIKIDEVRSNIKEIKRIMNRYGFEFKYYEDFKETSMEAKQFLKGDEWSFDYPALYHNGTLYCEFVGKRKVD